jgi:hypothetical protein
MKKYFLTALFVCFISIAFAQDGNWGIGLRLGEPSGITLKRYMGANAWDLTVGSPTYGRGGYAAGGLSVMFNYLWHNDFQGADGLQWYYGLGGNLHSRRYLVYDARRARVYDTRFALGVDGAIGLEWFIPGAPFSIYGDIVPSIEIIPNVGLYFMGGIGGRYTF